MKNFNLDKDIIINENFKIGLILSEWNYDITINLYNSIFNTLIKLGIFKKNIYTWKVPGAFELVYAADKICRYKENLNSIIVIGSIIKGETENFECISHSVSQGIKNINIKYKTPVIFCVLTDYNKNQSIKRSEIYSKYNKGIECAKTAIKMSFFKKNIIK